MGISKDYSKLGSPLSYIALDEDDEVDEVVEHVEDTVAVAIRGDLSESSNTPVIYVVDDDRKIQDKVEEKDLIIYTINRAELNAILLKTLREIDSKSSANLSKDNDRQKIDRQKNSLQIARDEFKKRYGYTEKWYEENDD